MNSHAFADAIVRAYAKIADAIHMADILRLPAEYDPFVPGTMLTNCCEPLNHGMKREARSFQCVSGSITTYGPIITLSPSRASALTIAVG